MVDNKPAMASWGLYPRRSPMYLTDRNDKKKKGGKEGSLVVNKRQAFMSRTCHTTTNLDTK